MECTCYIKEGEEDPQIVKCSLCEASSPMYKALKAILVDAHNSPYTSLICATRGLIDTALSKAVA